MSIPKNSQNLELDKKAAIHGLTDVEYEQKRAEYTANCLEADGTWTGGKIYLLTFGLKFVPHNFIQIAQPFGLLWTEIQAVHFSNRLFILRTGLDLELKDSLKKVRFITFHRVKIKSFIEAKISRN